MLSRQRIAIYSAAALILVAGGILLYLHVYPKAPSLQGAIYRDASYLIEERVADLMSRMTLREKIGQMTLVEKNSIRHLGHISDYGLGALLSGAGAKPENNTKFGWKEMVATYFDASKKSRLQIPILYGVDANHGQGNVPDATIFPHAIGLGSSGDEHLVEKVALAVAEESNALGISWIFGPSLDLPRDIRWGRVYEAFSDDSTLSGKLGAAFVRGLQGASADGTIHTLATPKHYLGVGGMLWGTSSSDTKEYRIDQGQTPVDEVTLREQYLPPFKEAIDAGAKSIMVGLNSWGDEKLSASHYLISDVLKGELGFTGFVVSDWYGVYEISPTDDNYRSAVIGINAGVDMVMLPYDYQEFIGDVEKAVARGDITEKRIDDAVRRILKTKFALGLFDNVAQLPIASVGSTEHHMLAREAVQKSLVLLKNEEDILPLASDLRKIRVAGSAADNVGMQAGAWTVEWQGVDGNVLPLGTSILKGITDVAGEVAVEYRKNGIFEEKDLADIGIAVVGEKPYAEGWGDNPYPQLSNEDIEAIEHLRASSRKVIVVLISGRPLFITDKIGAWDAVVAAWLPGSEGQGVADVLFGKVPFAGKLPVPWPKTLQQLPINKNGTADGTPLLFERGFGL